MVIIWFDMHIEFQGIGLPMHYKLVIQTMYGWVEYVSDRVANIFVFGH